MAFCMSKNSRSGLTAAQRPEQRKPRQSKSQIGKPPISTSPILQTQRQLKENISRDQAAKQILSQRKKKSFVIKTSIQQTRFSKKDIKDLKERFEKNSTWVLVNELGESLDAEGRVINYVQQQVQQQKQLMVDYQKGNNNYNGSHKSDNRNPANNNTANNFQLQKQSPNTSFTNSEKGPIARGFVKGGNYKKIEISLENQQPIHLGIHYQRKMSKNQFRNCMGLLGLESNAFLSDRIFDVVDSDNDQFITFAQFATIMDTLINGEEDEKHEFSFSLLDVYDTGYFDFEEFKEIISKIIAHWCIITGSQVKVEREGLREIFDRMDTNKDGIVDIDEYKKALKGNPQLFQWFDLLNQGIQDGKKTQKDIIDIKLKALTDVLELQNKLSTVMTQMRNMENTAQSNREYSSSKQSSSQFSNFGSSLSKQKRTSFKLEELNKSLERNINQEQDKSLLIRQKNIKSIEIQDNNYDKSILRKLLDGDQSTISPMSQNIKNSQFPISNNEVTENQFSFSDQVIMSVFPKKAIKKDSEEYNIQQIQKQRELQKLRKKEFGEKKSQIQQPQRKTTEDQNEDIIDDPDSPPVHKNLNDSQLNSKNIKNNLQNRFSQQNDLIQSQVYHLFGKNNGSLQNTNIRSVSPNFNLRNFTSNDNYQSRHERTASKQLVNRQNSNNSNNSQMQPEYQQSSQNLIQSFNQQQKLGQGHSRNNNVYNNSLSSVLKNQSQNPSLIIQNHGYQSDWSPNQTQDGQRSELNHPQGGGPANHSHRIVNESHLLNNEQRSLSNKKRRKNKTQSIIEDIISQNSQAYHAHNQNEQLKQQQAQIMSQLNDIQTLANHLLSQLQEDKDSVIGEQIKDYVEKQKQKIINNQDDSNSDEEEKQQNRISLNLDDGNLRPLNEIQTFFKVRSRQRLHESIKKSNHIHKPLSKNQNKSFIHIGHDNWNLVLHMMLGIRQSVRNVMHEEVFELIEQDFERKYCYELIAKKTKNMNVFEFYDFSPRVFHLIRTMYGITPDQYLKSIGPENLIGNLLMGNISSLKEQCSTGKSGSFFYYTADSNFMLKTISAAEFHNLRELLKEYYDHLAIYPHTLITRFFGLHKIKYSKTNGGKARIYFVIMANVFKTAREINVRFDLKGSTQGRKTKKGPNDFVDSSVALKDLDFIEQGIKVKVSPDIQKALKQQMQDDVRLFQRLNINDYSLLLGIHQLNDEEEARDILQNSPSIHQIIRNSFDVFQSKEKLGATYNSQKLLRPPIPFYEAHDGGIVSSDGKCVYFIGIIDTLTFFGAKKKLEYSLKSVAYGNKTISCIPPKNYGERFIGFMSNIFE